MRLAKLVMLAAGLTALTACESDDPIAPDIPATGQVRFINAVADTAAVDIRAIDQVEYSPTVSGLGFRQGTNYQAIEAKSRQFRVFANSRNINVTSVPLLDATVDIAANSRVTLLLTGSARNKSTLKLVQINDDISAPASGSIAVRVVNAATGAVDAYVVNAVADAISGAPTAANVAPLAASAYVTRTAGNAAVRVTNAGSTTATSSVAGPAAAAATTGALPAAGVNSAGTKFSIYYFTPGVGNNASLTTPAAVWFVDRNPADL